MSQLPTFNSTLELYYILNNMYPILLKIKHKWFTDINI